MLLIPALDLRRGGCVRLYQGDFGAETRYVSDPEALLKRYQSLGASWLHVVDLDGAQEGKLRNRSVIVQLAAVGKVRLQVGGGVRSACLIEELLDAGVARVVVGSAAIERPGEVAVWLKRFGSERMCLAFDVRLDPDGEPRVCMHGWMKQSGVSLWDAVGRCAAGSLRHVLCTDIARDGALTGPNLKLYEQALKRFPNLAWQASGGVRESADLAALERIGVTAMVAGKALL